MIDVHALLARPRRRRLAAATRCPTCIEREGTNCENLPETHAYLARGPRASSTRTTQGRMLLAEANQWPADVRAYFGDGDECHMAFHFPLMPRIFMAIRREERTPIVEILAQTPDLRPTASGRSSCATTTS